MSDWSNHFVYAASKAAIKVVASYTEDQIVTSNPQQLLEIEKAKKEFEAQVQEEAEAAAAAAKAGCPISRLLNAKITLDAKLET